MTTTYPSTLNPELNRTVARHPGLGSLDAGPVARLGRAGCGGPVAGLFQVPIPREPRSELRPPAPTPLVPAPCDETASVLMLYARDIGQFELLSREEEAALARRVRQGDAAAREKMIQANLRLVVKIARGFDGLGVPLLDLISEGNIGLMKAVDRYDPAKGAKVSVYASFWIKHRIRRALSDHGRTIRVSAYAQDKLQTVLAVRVRLQVLLGRDPTNDEIAQEAGMPVARVQSMREAAQAVVSLDEALDDRGERSVADTVADEQAIAPDEAAAQAAGLQQLHQFIGQLNAREQRILRWRFGLEGEQEATLVEIGQQLGLTRERVRQIQNSALAKLRKKLKELELQFLAA
jgi:RNA polymerase primary sigma factor